MLKNEIQDSSIQPDAILPTGLSEPTKRKYTKKNPNAKSNITNPFADTFPSPPTPIAAAIGSLTDFESLRLNTNYAENYSVKKVLVVVPVKKPNKDKFFRVREGAEWEFATFVLEKKEDNEVYLVTREIADVLGSLVRAVVLYSAIDRKSNPFLIPVTLPGLDGRRNNWHESLQQGVNRAKQIWIRAVPNMSIGSYDILEATGSITEPNWTEHTMQQLLEVAFRNKIIKNIDDPIVQGLLGAI